MDSTDVLLNCINIQLQCLNKVLAAQITKDGRACQMAIAEATAKSKELVEKNL